MKYTKKTKLADIVKDERAVEILMNEGIYCLGCPMSNLETLEQGCKAHGLNVNKVLEKLNKQLLKKVGKR